MIQPDKILKRMLVSEKASMLAANANQYAFQVASSANRIVVKRAIEEAFRDKGVKVASVNILNVKSKLKRDRRRGGRMGRKAGYKKAIVTLKEGAIELV